MGLFQLDPTRIFTVYVAQGLIVAIFLFIAYKVLKRDTKRLNLIFSGFYIFVALGLTINFIYAPLTDEAIVLTLYYVLMFSLNFSAIFLTLFNAILLRSEKVITGKKQLIISLIYMAILIGMVFIPQGITINATTEWKPVWSIIYFIYIIAAVTIMGIGPSLYYSKEIYKKFEDEQLKKKWKYFIIGQCEFYAFMYGLYVSNTLNDATFRTVIGVIGLILVITGGILVYYGVGRQLSR